MALFICKDDDLTKVCSKCGISNSAAKRKDPLPSYVDTSWLSELKTNFLEICTKKDVVFITTLLYTNCEVFLDRKFNKFKEQGVN